MMNQNLNQILHQILQPHPGHGKQPCFIPSFQVKKKLTWSLIRKLSHTEFQGFQDEPSPESVNTISKACPRLALRGKSQKTMIFNIQQYQTKFIPSIHQPNFQPFLPFPGFRLSIGSGPLLGFETFVFETVTEEIGDHFQGDSFGLLDEQKYKDGIQQIQSSEHQPGTLGGGMCYVLAIF